MRFEAPIAIGSCHLEFCIHHGRRLPPNSITRMKHFKLRPSVTDTLLCERIMFCSSLSIIERVLVQVLRPHALPDEGRYRLASTRLFYTGRESATTSLAHYRTLSGYQNHSGHTIQIAVSTQGTLFILRHCVSLSFFSCQSACKFLLYVSAKVSMMSNNKR